MIKIQIKSVFGKLLFEYEKENNTIKETLLKAIESDVDLRYADLRNADLSNANLSNANLSNADLSNAYLRNANLYNADLYNADLSNANLYNAYLYNANLSNADLSNAYLRNADLSNAKNKEEAKISLYCKWSLAFIGDKIKIGCKEKNIQEWDKWFAGSEKYDTERGTEEFKRIEAMYKAYKAYYEYLNG